MPCALSNVLKNKMTLLTRTQQQFSQYIWWYYQTQICKSSTNKDISCCIRKKGWCALNKQRIWYMSWTDLQLWTYSSSLHPLTYCGSAITIVCPRSLNLHPRVFPPKQTIVIPWSIVICPQLPIGQGCKWSTTYLSILLLLVCWHEWCSGPRNTPQEENTNILQR